MMAKIMAPDNYALQYGEGDTRFKRLMGISGPAQMNLVGDPTDITTDPLDEGPVGGSIIDKIKSLPNAIQEQILKQFGLAGMFE